MFEKVDKMLIKAYGNADFKESMGSFTAQVNPESYHLKYEVEYCDEQAPGTSAVNLRYSKTPPQEFTFQFLFDNTGVIKDPSVVSIGFANPLSKDKNEVTKQIEQFKQTILNYQGEIHRPNFLKLYWGTLQFKGVMTKMDIEYKLFNTKGEPIRAVAEVSFKGSIEDKLRNALEGRQSADITHKKVFKANDNFSLMAEKVYGSNQYYLEVAKFNRLNSFRKIKSGTALFFPPLSQK